MEIERDCVEIEFAFFVAYSKGLYLFAGPKIDYSRVYACSLAKNISNIH